MADSNIKVVIVDEDDNRKKLIQSYLPGYMDSYFAKYGEDAWKLILPEDGEKADLVIMYADDNRGRSTYTFDWMKTQNIDKGVYKIPVVLITSDMFSDRALEFLEIGEAEFLEYHNEIDETELFSVVMEALDKAESMKDVEEIYPPEPEKEPVSADRIMGMSFEEPVSIPRTVVYNDKEIIEKISKSVKSSIVQTKHVREVIAEAVKAPEGLHKITPASAASLLKDDVVQPVTNIQSFAKTPTYARQSKILVVDTDQKSEKAISLFAPQGCEVVFVDSVMRAIDYFIKDTANLIIIRYDMPNMRGHKILESIRRHPNGSRVPAAILFEKDYDKNLIHTVENMSGIIGVMEKPIIRKQLNVILARCNQRR